MNNYRYIFLKTLSNIFICNIIETLENTNRRKSSTIHNLYVCKSYCFLILCYIPCIILYNRLFSMNNILWWDFQLRWQIKLQNTILMRSKFPLAVSHWEIPKRQDWGCMFCGSLGQRQSILIQSLQKLVKVWEPSYDLCGPRNMFSASSNTSKF